MTGAPYATAAAFCALRERAAPGHPPDEQGSHGKRWRAASGAVRRRCVPVIARTRTCSAHDQSTGWWYVPGNQSGKCDEATAELLFCKALPTGSEGASVRRESHGLAKRA